MGWRELAAEGVDFQALLLVVLLVIGVYWAALHKRWTKRRDQLSTQNRIASAETRAEIAELHAENVERRAEVVQRHLDLVTSELDRLVVHHSEMATLDAEITELRVANAVAAVNLTYSQRECRRLTLANDIKYAQQGHILYRFMDDEGELIYVGITGSMQRRARQHQETKDWWSHVAEVRLEYFQTRTDLANAERLAITVEHPRENVIVYRGSSPCLTT